ncbi:MAG: OsmC family protein [Solirubrobacterales bacterium]
MRVVARRLDGFAHEVELEGGHSLVVDEPPDRGGTDTGPRPTQLLAASLAGCTAITIEMYADRKGWDVGAVEVEVDVAYDGHVPSTYAVALKLPRELSEEQRQLLLRVAAKCPVHKVLVGEATVTVAERLEAL